MAFRKFQQTPGTYPRYPKSMKDSLHKQLIKSLGYVPGVCWNFVWNGLLENRITMKMNKSIETALELNISEKVLVGLTKSGFISLYLL